MAARKIVWSANAAEQLNTILEYYLQRNGNNVYGSRLYKTIIKTTKLLATQPYIGRRTDDEDVKVLLIGVYLVFYEITVNEIHILVVWDGRRNPKELNKLIGN
jgi:plasmid stabilization system protein ParE